MTGPTNSAWHVPLAELVPVLRLAADAVGAPGPGREVGHVVLFHLFGGRRARVSEDFGCSGLVAVAREAKTDETL